MADNERNKPKDIPTPRADALTPVRPTAKEQDIAMKVYIYIYILLGMIYLVSCIYLYDVDEV